MGGKKWKCFREKLAPTLTLSNIKMMFPIVMECGDVLIDVLDKFAEGREIVEVQDYLARFSIDVIASCAFGIEANSLKNPECSFRKMAKKVMEPSFINRLKYLIFFYPKLAEFLKVCFKSL